MVMDATGVGEGLWAMFDKRHPARVIPVKFNASVKSDLGYGFLAIVNTGRFRDCAPSPTIDRQYAACVSEILTGPAKTMRWSVPDGTRDENGELIHDDFVLCDALTAILDKMEWFIQSQTEIIERPDPILAMDRNY
jgi:hypothetical protein